MTIAHGSPIDSHAQRLKVLFRSTPVLDLPAIERALPGRSVRSIFRDLDSLAYVASYTHAGRYYALRDACPFDDDGLWLYQGIGFSRRGTLKSTVEHLVAAADDGRTHDELRRRLAVRAHNTLLDLFRSQRVGRVSIDGSFLYVSPVEGRAAAQQACRLERMAAERRTPQRPSLEVEIEVLREVIKGAAVMADASVVAAGLAARDVVATAEQVEAVLRRHGLEKKVVPSPSRPSPR